MIKIMQTITGPTGNCLAACVASVLEIPLYETPSCIHPPIAIGDTEPHWFEQFNAWLNPYGMRAVISHMRSLADRPVNVWGIASFGVKTTHNTHCIVMYNDEIMWDPSPVPYDRGLLVPRMWMMFVATNPQDLVRQSKTNSMLFH